MSRAKSFGERVAELAKARGTSVSQVVDDAYTHERLLEREGAIKRRGGFKPETIRKALAGTRRPTEDLVEILAGELGVDPSDEFVEYRLAYLRHLLDEREEQGVGFDSAAELLQRIEKALGPSLTKRSSPTADERSKRRPKDPLGRKKDLNLGRAIRDHRPGPRTPAQPEDGQAGDGTETKEGAA